MDNLTPNRRVLLAVLCLVSIGAAAAGADMQPNRFQLTSSAYKDQAPMDDRFTCEGDSVSPPLRWSGAPAGTKSFVLIVDDPDAPDPSNPQRTFVHWVIYDIPAEVTDLKEGASKELPGGAHSGANDRGDAAYTGPCPPIGRHRYFHKLYALDVVLPDLHNPNKTQLLAAMKGHVLGETQLIGTYQKH